MLFIHILSECLLNKKLTRKEANSVLMKQQF